MSLRGGHLLAQSPAYGQMQANLVSQPPKLHKANCSYSAQVRFFDFFSINLAMRFFSCLAHNVIVIIERLAR